jgi:DNA-binding CsgD family transcriptional regulator/N-acetylneuraminic acid mutarotase
MSDINSSGLSERELEILRLVATGASNKEIAQHLFISTNTVKVHIRNIFNKIDATSRTEAAMYAVRVGLVQPISDSELELASSVSDKDQDLFIPPSEILKKEQQYKREKWIRRGFLASLGVLLVVIIVFGMEAIQNISSTPGSASQSPMPSLQEQWRNLTPLPTDRTGLAVVAYENQIFTFGGQTSDGVSGVSELLDLQTNIWSQVASKPLPVADINAASIGGLIYIPGGRSSSGDPINSMEIYDPKTNQWLPGTNLPKAISGYGLVTYEGKLYVIGGWDGSQVLKDVYMYDPDLEEWLIQTPMPTARAFHGAAVVGDSIYVIGGSNGTQALNINEVYHPNLDKDGQYPWEIGASVPTGRFAMGMTNIADSIYLIGGEGSQEPYKVLVFSPYQNEWGQLEAPTPQKWSMLAAVTIGTRLFALGGISEAGLVNEVWSYQVIYINTLPIIRE